MWKQVVLWLFVINLGVAFGAGIYEARVVIPPWRGIPPRQWPNTGILFWAYVTTVPLTLLTILNLIAAWTTAGPARSWYLASVIIIVIERMLTFGYFIPAMVRMMGTEGGPDVLATLSQWLMLNNGRHVLTLTGWLLALKVFASK